MYQNIPTKVLTGVCRLSYPNLYRPQTPLNGTGEPMYSCTLLIPKTDTATYNDIQSAVEAAKAQALTGSWQNAAPPNPSLPLYDGDGVQLSGKPWGDECKGHWVLRAKSKRKPQCVHVSNVHTELLETDVYAGCNVRATINVYGYNAAGKKGISFGLGNILKVADGEPLAGGASAEADFADLEQQPVGNTVNPATGQVAGNAINPITGQPMF